MDERQLRTVEKHRSRIEALRIEAEGQQVPGKDSSNNKSQEKLKRKQDEYAQFRLKEGLGSDSAFIEDDILDVTLRDFIARDKIASLANEQPTRIGSLARQALLLSGFSLYADSGGQSSVDPKDK